MSSQGQGGGSDGQAAGSAGANPRDVKERTEQKDMHSKDAHEAAKDGKAAPSAPLKGNEHKPA